MDGASPCLGLARNIQKNERIQPIEVIPSNKIQSMPKRFILLGCLKHGIPHEQDQRPKRKAADCREPQRPFQQPRSISEWSSHKTNQHERSQPQHRRVEEPFLRQARHPITNRHEDQNPIKFFRAPSRQSSNLAHLKARLLHIGVDAGRGGGDDFTKCECVREGLIQPDAWLLFWGGQAGGSSLARQASVLPNSTRQSSSTQLPCLYCCGWIAP